MSTYYTFRLLLERSDKEKIPPKTCEMEANCNRFHSCVGGKCLQFFPTKPANQTKCHKKCKHDLVLYEEKYYRQKIDHIIFLKGVDSEHCLIAYKQTGATRSYDNETYPKYYLENIKQREILKGWILGLCISPTA